MFIHKVMGLEEDWLTKQIWEDGIMIVIKCPQCEAETKLSLLDPTYEGPYRCWKCKALFDIEIVGDQLKLCQPLDEEEFRKRQEIAEEESHQKQQIAALKAKFRRPG